MALFLQLLNLVLIGCAVLVVGASRSGWCSP
jgi:hypothetical protein